MKEIAKKVAIGGLWFLGFTVATNLVVRPAWRALTAKVNAPALIQSAL